MAVSEELKRLLVCPQCKGPLAFHDDRRQIVCAACRLAYPVLEGDLPVLLIDQATTLTP